MRFPTFLSSGDTIGITAPSYGATTEPYISRFKDAARQLRLRGYHIKEGSTCTKSDGLGISTDPRTCAQELMDFYEDKETQAVISCGGGELMCETMTHINLERIAAAEPKWFMGYSDNTNFIFPLVTCCNVAAIYGHCITGFGKPWEQSESDTFALLEGTSTCVHGYPKFQLPQDGTEAKEENPLSPYILSEEKILASFLPSKAGSLTKAAAQEQIQFSGLLLGGCLDVLDNLTGTRFDCMKKFNSEHGGIIWALEACDYSPMDIRRAIWHMDECGWFKNAAGFIIGRPRAAFRQEMFGVDTYNAVTDILAKYTVPVIMDADIGHIAPSMPLIMGSSTEVCVQGNDISLDMRCIQA